MAMTFTESASFSLASRSVRSPRRCYRPRRAKVLITIVTHRPTTYSPKTLGTSCTQTVRVLIADDSAAFAVAAVETIERTPTFELVGLCASGEEAVAASAHLKPDLVFVDANMPGLGGVEAAIRIQLENPDAVVVMITATRDWPLPAAALSAGIAGSIDKLRFRPLELSTLWEQHRGAAPTTSRPEPRSSHR
jgi:CheY-like chemotaxis protein